MKELSPAPAPSRQRLYCKAAPCRCTAAPLSQVKPPRGQTHQVWVQLSCSPGLVLHRQAAISYMDAQANRIHYVDVQVNRMLQAKVEMLRTNLEAARTEAAAADSLRKEVATLRSQLTAGSADMVAAVAEIAGGVSQGDGHVQALQQELAQVSLLLGESSAAGSVCVHAQTL